jgi:hypothetical protein
MSVLIFSQSAAGFPAERPPRRTASERGYATPGGPISWEQGAAGSNPAIRLMISMV